MSREAPPIASQRVRNQVAVSLVSGLVSEQDFLHVAGIWATYVLQATICMRPEPARSWPEGQELDRPPEAHPCSLRGHGNHEDTAWRAFVFLI